MDSKVANWLPSKEKQKKWTTEERERMLAALSVLPEALLLDSVKKIYRFEKSQNYDQNPASGQDGILGIYDSAFAKNSNLSRILAHELAHELYRQIPDANTETYLKASGWLIVIDPLTRRKTAYPNRDQYVEEDGPESDTEDFSNNIEYFLFNPDRLQKVTPGAYNWISKKYGDKSKLAKERKK